MMKIYINEERMWEPVKRKEKVRMRLREEESEVEKGKQTERKGDKKRESEGVRQRY